MRDQEVLDLYEAYASIYAQEEVVEEVEELDEAGLPYGPVGKGFKKLPAGKKRAAMMKRADDLRTQAMKDDGDGGEGSPRGKMGKINSALTNPRLREGVDLFDTILEHLVAEGYADTNEAALVIMANMSEEWRQSILDEAYQEPKFGKKQYIKKLSKRGGMGMGTPEDPHGYRDPKMAKVGAELSKRKTAAAKAKRTGEPDEYRAEKEAQSKRR